MKIALKYSIIKTPSSDVAWRHFLTGCSLPLFEDELHWKSLSKIDSDYALVGYNYGYEICKSDAFREKVNKIWEECLLNNAEKTFTYELDLETFKENDTENRWK